MKLIGKVAMSGAERMRRVRARRRKQRRCLDCEKPALRKRSRCRYHLKLSR